jgi:N-formylglutamate deformylase
MLQTLPLLISTPHCSHSYPLPILELIRKGAVEKGWSEERLRLHLLKKCDRFTDRIYDIPRARITLNAVVSRYVVDLNRARDHEGDNGVIKMGDLDKVPFYPQGHVLDEEEKQRRLRMHYDPYHAELAAAVARPDIIFFIDGHSMSRKGPVISSDPGKLRPAFCLANGGDAQGEPKTNPTSCTPAHARAIKGMMEEIFVDMLTDREPERRVTLNQPYNGGYILKRYSDPKAPAFKPGIMIEINSELYKDDETQQELPGRVEALNAGMRRLAERITELMTKGVLVGAGGR